MAKIIKRAHPKFPWLVRIYTPSQQQRSFATRKEAEAWLPEARAIERGGKTETFRVYACRWLDQTASSKRAPYVRKNEGIFRNHIFPVIGDIPLDKITREMCKNLILNPDWSAAIARNAGMLVNSVLNEAVRDKRIGENPARGIHAKYDGKRAVIPPITYGQLETISAELGEFGLAPWLQYGLGLRIGEALAVRADGMRDDGTMFRVEEQVNMEGRNYEAIQVPLKHRVAGDFRDIPLPSWLKARIDAHIAEHDVPPDGYLFRQVPSGRAVGSAYYKLFRKGRAKAGIPELVPHMLRHHFASVMLRNKMPLTDVSRWLGHTKIQITFSTYSHLMPNAASESRQVSDTAMKEFRSIEG